MRNLKRFLAMTLTMLMVVGCFAMTSSAKFDDVTDFQNEITILSNLGVIKGKADGTFGFDEAVTRRQEALFIARAATGKVNDTVWTSAVNNSQFTDLDATGDYYGAISYCANLGIIKGRTTTAFYPNDNIIFQEAVAMVVRSLGYGSATMDAGYPYTYYSKAVSLGLDKGIEDVALTDVVSRGVAAKLLFNTLFAINSEGTTMASEAFGASVQSTNLVLIATDGKKLVSNYSLPSAAGTAAFCEFNSNGTLNLDKVYNLSWSDFSKLAYGADTTEKAVDHVGASFAVTTIDGFKTLATVTENASKTFTQADAAGNGTIAGTSYTLVNNWSSVFTTGTTWDGKNELMQFNTAFTKGGVTGNTAFYGNNWYVVDASNNILATDGSILLYYKPNTTLNQVFPFCYKIGADYYPAYLPVDGSAYAGAATVSQLNAKATYATDKNAASYTTNVNAYADTVAYDDNNDGTYDRAYFTSYTFGQFFSFSKDGHTYYNVTLGAHGDRVSAANSIDGANRGYKDIALTNISGKDVKDGSYVLWAMDAVNGNLIIKKVFDTVESGYVTGVDVINKTLTFSTASQLGLSVGTTNTVKYGVAKLPGATNTNISNGITSINDDGTGTYSTESLIGISYTLLYKSVSYIVDDEHDNKIIAIVGEKTADTPLVVTNFDDTSLLTYGYFRMSVIDPSGTTQLITVTKINGIPTTNYNFIVYMGPWFDVGDLVYGAKQDDGTWILSTTQNLVPEYKNVSGVPTTFTFYNGIAYENLVGTGVTQEITPALSFKADGSTLVIIVNNDDGTYTIAKGVPANGSTFTISDNADIYAKAGYMYIDYADYVTFSANGWNITTAYENGTVNDVIYLKSATSIGGSNYSYTYLGSYFSVLTGSSNSDIGGYINSGIIYSDSILDAGKFYEVTKTVQNGTTILNVNSYNDVNLSTVYIKSFSDNFAELVNADGTPASYVVGKTVKVYNWANTDLSTQITAQPAAGTYYKALTYTGSAVNGNTQYFLVTDAAYTVPVVTPTYTVALAAPSVGNFYTQNGSDADDVIVADYTVNNTTTTPSVPVDLTSSTTATVAVSVIDTSDNSVVDTTYASVAFTGTTVTITGLQSVTTYGTSVTVKSDLAAGTYAIEVTLTYNGVSSTYGTLVTIA